MTEKEGHLSPQMVAMLIHIGNGNLPFFRREGAAQTYYGLRHRGLVNLDSTLTEAGRAEYLRQRGIA